ncbi:MULTISPECIES: uL11 family ribosomal protein [Actinoalloteichus]|uniref:Large ribosomal subunit protein uL11 n=1 Tax=Actinoalloteichus fjordicus TaxID=1612552 RepID=A0AAC9LB13_9PSEU|nr:MULTISPECIES: 50S ribosomal protein L11 [Actinoalloteichus]APU14292.1 ribosomal protein L11 [Actinoalloteichus fjordicus]APU20261.1 ribosomal protein L11 [Actinoalloteichus sp. GBA129-24]
MPPKQRKTFEATLELEAGNAAMVDLGKMLGPTGVNTRNVKLEYDENTSAHRGEIVPVVVSVFEDRTYKLRYKTPPTSFLIRQAMGAKSGSERPGHVPGGTISKEQVQAIAERKMPDLNAGGDLEAAMKIVAGSARSMGVTVQA